MGKDVRKRTRRLNNSSRRSAKFFNRAAVVLFLPSSPGISCDPYRRKERPSRERVRSFFPDSTGVSSFGFCLALAGETFTLRENDRSSVSFSCPIPWLVPLRPRPFVNLPWKRGPVFRRSLERCLAIVRPGRRRRPRKPGESLPSVVRSLFSFTPRDLGYRRVTAVTRAPREKVPAIVNSNRWTEETASPPSLLTG